MQTNRQMKIPAMGFSDYFIQTVTTDSLPSTVLSTGTTTGTAEDTGVSTQKSDQEILESIEDCYYNADINADLYELKVRKKSKVNHFSIYFSTFRCRKYYVQALTTI